MITPVPATGQGLTAFTAVLADGMGGHAGGALASTTACSVFMRSLEASAAAEVTDRLDDALKLANAAIGQCVEENPALDGMGCTLIGTVFSAAGVEWVSVGDSPLYLLRQAEIVSLNEDHSLAPEIDKLAAAGHLSWEDAKNDPRRHFLRSALTGADMELIDRSRRPLPLEKDDVVILASDGIHTLSSADIMRIVQENAARGCEAIADAAARCRGGRRRHLPGQHHGGGDSRDRGGCGHLMGLRCGLSRSHLGWLGAAATVAALARAAS